MIPRHIHSILGIGRRFLGMVKFLSGSLKLLGRNFQFQGWRTAILVGTEFLGGTVIDPRNGNNDHVCTLAAGPVAAQQFFRTESLSHGRIRSSVRSTRTQLQAHVVNVR